MAMMIEIHDTDVVAARLTMFFTPAGAVLLSHPPVTPTLAATRWAELDQQWPTAHPALHHQAETVNKYNEK